VNFPGNAEGDSLVNPLTATGRFNPYTTALTENRDWL
jgi:hypothetical protein